MSGARSRRWWPAAISLGGVAAAVVVAEVVGVPGKDTLTVLVEALVGATLAGLAATLLLVVLRRARVAIQAAVAALAPVAAVAIGITWATSDMFITEHDLRILWVVLVAAGAAGMAVSVGPGWPGGRGQPLGRRHGPPVWREAGRWPSTRRRRHGSGRRSRTAAGRYPVELADAGDRAASSPLSRLAEKPVGKAASRWKGSRPGLVAWVSHDLRTPLAGITGHDSEALEDGVVQRRAEAVKPGTTATISSRRRTAWPVWWTTCSSCPRSSPAPLSLGWGVPVSPRTSFSPTPSPGRGRVRAQTKGSMDLR